MTKIPEGIGSKYRFIIIAAERAKQLQGRAKPKVKIKSTKPARIAMRELQDGLISYEIIDISQPG
ncbi:MAG: DNA-directed RNA polymerase subunit omega [Acidobacteria bacterium]|nr:DNA-directed RNA polymerase subunit omega [Acidobacteriota bacterium]